MNHLPLWQKGVDHINSKNRVKTAQGPKGNSNVVLLPFCENVNQNGGVVLSILGCFKKSTILNNF